ncbi:ATP-binding protein [Roseburia hominis]
MREKHDNDPSQILLISVCVIIGAQINMNLFIDDFVISIGILVIPVTFILTGKYPVLPVTFLSAAGVLASRVLAHWFRYETLNVRGYFPEMIFYLVYGLLFYLYCKRRENVVNGQAIPFLFFFDYFSNLTELLLRLHADAFTSKTQISILLIAFSRALILWGTFTVLDHYKFSLLNRAHAQRYQRLLLLITKLNGEVLWMKKNTGLIEETMNSSYRLYRELDGYELPPELSRDALRVTRDIHEIKKEYALILRGLSDALDLNMNDEGMYLEDILTVLKNSLTRSCPEGKQLEVHTDIEENLYTRDHYFLMSILRNLFNNALEAADEPLISLIFRQRQTDERYLFEVEDHGPGIDPEDLSEIFSPGFSTKINYETGEVNRGLGLGIVQDMVENQWHGEISVTSHPGQTIFRIQIPKKYWRGHSE